jgi:dCMP deaminase
MNWDDYAMALAQVAATKSKDPWQKVGSVILRLDNSIASIGYNGFPQGVTEDWEDRDKRRLLVIHAEQNALRYTKPGEGKTLYSTLLPCNDCLKSIAAYNIKKVIFKDIYLHDPSSLIIADNLNIELIHYK